MCNQTIGLIAAELERRGITTVCLILLRSIAEEVRPPRALALPFPHGYPLGKPNDAEMQREVMRAALNLLNVPAQPPLLVDYPSPPTPDT